MTPLATRLLPHASDICDKLGCSLGDEEGGLVACGKLGELEHLIHELSHAVLLHLDVVVGRKPGLAEKISELLTFPLYTEDERIMEEARAWGVEWHVWQQLDLTQLTYHDAVDHAGVQGVSRAQLDACIEEMAQSDEVTLVIDHLKRLDRCCHSGNMT